MSESTAHQGSRASKIIRILLNILYAGICIACSVVILLYGKSQDSTSSRAISGFFNAAVSIVFNIMLLRRRLQWVITPIITDTAMILINISTLKSTQVLTIPDYMSATLVGAGTVHYCLGIMELYHMLLQQKREKESADNDRDEIIE